MGKFNERIWYVVQTKIRCEDQAAKKLRQAGYRVYLPKMRKDIIHHRSKKRQTKYFVLFNRYIFVGVPAWQAVDWFRLTGCEGVDCVLGQDGPDGRKYLPVPRKMVLSFAAAQRNLEFDDTRRADLHRKKIGRTAKATLEIRFPQGSRFRVRRDWQHTHPFGGFYGNVIKVAGQQKIRAMLELFGSMVRVEFHPNDIERVDNHSMPEMSLAS